MNSYTLPFRIPWLCLMTTAVFFFLVSACDQQQTRTAPPPPEVVTLEITEQPLALTTELPGRTSAYLMAEVRPQVSGIIQKRLFKEGSMVNAGQLLYQIDPATFQAAYNSATASLTRAQANIPPLRSRAERFRKLLADNAVSQQDFDSADSAFRQAQAEVSYWEAAVESARINLEHTHLTAPISGRIGKSNITKGALVTANQPSALAVIQQFDPIYVDVPQSTADLLRLKQRIKSGSLDINGKSQKKVGLILEDGSKYPLEGSLEFRDVTVDPSSGTVNLRAVFPNPDDVLLPGMFVRAVVQEGINKQAILIPQEAVSRDPKGNPLTLIVDTEGTVRQRPIEIDRAVSNQWLIAGGLAPGEQIIIEGMLKVRPGMKVRATPSGREEKRPMAQAPPAPAEN